MIFQYPLSFAQRTATVSVSIPVNLNLKTDPTYLPKDFEFTGFRGQVCGVDPIEAFHLLRKIFAHVVENEFRFVGL